MSAMPVTPEFEDLKEPGKYGRLLARYDRRRGILKIKRPDGPECTFDLADMSAKAQRATPQTAADGV